MNGMRVREIRMKQSNKSMRVKEIRMKHKGMTK